MNTRWLMIKQLDKQLKEWQAASNKYGRPKAGWVKTLRKALNMSAEQLANRLGLSRPRITQLENAEIHDAVTLRTLREAAHAMECEFVYAIVPKNHDTLENIIKTKIEQVAEERVARVAHSMALEAQALDTDILNTQKAELTKNLIEHLNKNIWTTPENQKGECSKLSEKNYNHALKDKENNLHKKLIETLKKKKQ